MWLFGLSEVVSGTLIYVVKNLGGGGGGGGRNESVNCAVIV